MIVVHARGARTVSGHNGVAWGAWSFSVTQRPSTGVAITDIRFRDERIVYELALMDAQAIYGGALRDQFMYSDSAYTLSQWSASLEPGVDCPSEATYLSAVNWMGPDMNREPDPRKAQTFWPICIFDWAEDHEIWRHMDGNHVRGLVRKTVVVRSIATVGNYDYIMDVKFRDDGEIHVETRFAGYPETRFPGKGEEAFSTLVRDGVAGIVHTHSVAWKADIEIAGSKNALHVTEVREHASEGLGVDWKADPKEPSFPTKILQHRYVEREGGRSAQLDPSGHVPKAWAIVNRNSSVSRGSHKNPRGYRIELLSFATGQVHGASHPFVRAMPWTKYHLAVTKYQDNEYRPSSPYVNFDGLQPLTGAYAQDLDVFLSNNAAGPQREIWTDSLLDEDLTLRAWYPDAEAPQRLQRKQEHIVRQEDLPLVSNFGVSFSLQPWNFFDLNTAAVRWATSGTVEKAGSIPGREDPAGRIRWDLDRHLVDRREIRVLGGHGGPGSCAYKRHAKHKMIGPGFPCGGSGGRGGDVIVEAGGSFFSLAHLDGHVEAGDGMAGKKGNLNGESGRNSKILVPRGTMVRELSGVLGEEETEELADLNQLGDSIVVAKGGRGGMGNNMARPHESSEGQPGDDRRIELELKTVADVGLVGMPNAGKSTLLGSVSRAAPKIAPYPFTTVAPYVGKVDFVDGSSLSVADVPGLVEGAHRGEGLGHEFLRHLERTKVLMYVVDCARSPDPFGDYLSLQREVEAFSIMMAWKPSALVATKCDVKPEETLRKVDALYRSVRAAEESLGPAAPLFVRAISARFGEGISGLLQELRLVLQGRHERLARRSDFHAVNQLGEG
ncbi:GTPase Obg (GTP-binding protein Obg) [Durusdinium trenchii]|uniref:GTPase Obg (GTP-binding protein Obg) n=1 Tax=Durusdinium trenchii TaxID=1381693 RepID=A0ABP0JIH6_9DINO